MGLLDCQFWPDKCKALSAKVVLGVSLAIGVLSLLTLAFAALQNGYVQEKVNLNNFVLEGFDTKTFGNAILALGVFGCITACLGVMAAKKKSFLFTLPFMIISGIIGLALLAFAAMVLGRDGGFVKKLTDGACKKIAEAKPRPLYEDYDYVSRAMCSVACPCDSQYRELW